MATRFPEQRWCLPAVTLPVSRATPPHHAIRATPRRAIQVSEKGEGPTPRGVLGRACSGVPWVPGTLVRGRGVGRRKLQLVAALRRYSSEHVLLRLPPVASVATDVEEKQKQIPERSVNTGNIWLTFVTDDQVLASVWRPGWVM